MNRRQFLQTSAAMSATLLALQCGTERTNTDIATTLIRLNDKRISSRMGAQELDIAHPWVGGVKDQYGIHSSGLTSGFIRDWTCAFVSPASRYYQSEELLLRLRAAARFMLKRQHADGTIDLHTTNFHSTPDTAFVMEWMCAAYGLLAKFDDPHLDEPKSTLQDFILKAGKPLSSRGIHTPNHRWVVCMALARANALFPNEKYVQRIDEWLAEHIDIDPDGQYTEKSSSIYSPLTNRCLITVARLLNRDELFGPVRKNLNMTLYYVHPNGEVVTEASRRQDKYKYGSMSPYYYPYRYMALKDGNGQFAAMAGQIEENPAKLTGALIYFLEDKSLSAPLPVTAPLQTNYEKIFSHSNLARFRREHISATVLADNFTFFSYRKGDAILRAVRLASAFFGKGQFKGEKLELKDGVYVMSQKLEGPYYQPFPKDDIPEDGDWEMMDKEKREKSEIQDLESTISVREKDGEFTIDIDITGTNRVPVALELAFGHDGSLEGVEKIKDIKDAYFLKQDDGQFRVGKHAIRFGPGKHAHRWTQLRGAEEKLDAQCVYLTGFTPVNWILFIK